MTATGTETAGVPCVLSDELEMFRESVRSFARARLAPGYLERALGDDYPYDLVREMGAQGLLGMEVSPEHGGQGADSLAVGIACEEIARADFSLAYLALFATTSG